jgi:hypothetical protein
MREVSKEEFYKAIGPQNVHPRVIGPHPYTSSFVTPNGTERGRAVDFMPRVNGKLQTKYLLPNASI